MGLATSQLRRKRLLAMVGAICVTAGVAGAVGAWWTYREEGTPAIRAILQDASAAGPNGEEAISAPDPAIEFPSAMANLDGPPNHLAIQTNTGDPWFLTFTYNGVANVLNHYSRAKDTRETFEIPSSNGSELYSAIGVDGRGHILLAEGTLVTDFDPVSKDFSQTAIGAPRASTVAYSPPDATQILDMAISENGTLYLSRINVPAITELDLSTGKTRELPYPASFGAAYDVELGNDKIWMTSRWDIEGLSSAQTGSIRLADGFFTRVGDPTTALVRGPNGSVEGIRASTNESRAANLVRISEGGMFPIELASEAEVVRSMDGLGILDFIAIDRDFRRIWVTGEGSESIFRVDSESGRVREYALPIYSGFEHSCPPPLLNETPSCPVSTLSTRVRGLASGSDGELYFADATMHRVGIIRGQN